MEVLYFHKENFPFLMSKIFYDQILSPPISFVSLNFSFFSSKILIIKNSRVWTNLREALILKKANIRILGLTYYYRVQRFSFLCVNGVNYNWNNIYRLITKMYEWHKFTHKKATYTKWNCLVNQKLMKSAGKLPSR